jgi:hypothetical protein
MIKNFQIKLEFMFQVVMEVQVVFHISEKIMGQVSRISQKIYNQ